MNQIRTILVGIDFSESARSALEQAVRLAHERGAHLRLLHVLEPIPAPASAGDIAPLLDDVQQLCQRHAAQRLEAWAAAAGAPAGHDRSVVVGVPLEVLLTESRQRGCDLLVLGHGGGAAGAAGAGTLATKCVRKAGLKVLLVKSDRARPFRRLVAGVDFSRASRAAVDQSWRVAAGGPAERHFVHVFTPSWQRWASLGELPALADFERGYRVLLEGNLRQFVAAPEGAPATHAVTAAPAHGAGLADYCRRVDADLVVVGTKGHSDLPYVRLGGTVERLLRETPCSVLVVPAETGSPATV